MRHVSTKLLHVFVLLMEYRDLSAVAACTQGRIPTVAYSLARLREITGDALFVKRNGMLEPTPHALRLEQTARQILARWNHLVQPQDHSGPAASNSRRISIGFSPSIGDPVITEILTALCERFPHDSFITRPVIADAALGDCLDAGDLDCAFVVDGASVPDSVIPHSILATPRRLVSATRGGGSNDEAETDWILLQEDCESGSPLHAFLTRRASTPGHRETVVPSWHTQITLLHAAGGICPILDFNVPLVTRDRKTRLLAPPAAFPAWAALHFWMPQRAPDRAALREIMDVGTSVLRDPLKAIDSRRHAQNQARPLAVA